jgi:hypothetical protein
MYDEEQCPKRLPGLGHVSDDGFSCMECGKLRPNTLAEYLRMRLGLGPITPRVVKVSGDANVTADVTTEPDEERIGDFAALTEREWHAITVERRYHERHQCDDR